MKDHEAFRQTLARLHAAIATQRAQVIADPLPFLQKAHDQMLRMHQTLLAVEDALNDMNYTYDEAVALNVPPDYYKDAVSRVDKARAVLRTYINGDTPSRSPT